MHFGVSLCLFRNFRWHLILHGTCFCIYILRSCRCMVSLSNYDIIDDDYKNKKKLSFHHCISVTTVMARYNDKLNRRKELHKFYLNIKNWFVDVLKCKNIASRFIWPWLIIISIFFLYTIHCFLAPFYDTTDSTLNFQPIKANDVSSTPPPTPFLKYYHFSTSETTNRLTPSDEMIQYQHDREELRTEIHLESLDENVLMVHHDVSADVNISRYLSNGQWFEEDIVYSMAEHIKLILDSIGIIPCDDESDDYNPDCDTSSDMRHRMSFIDIGANLGVYSIAFGKHFQSKYPFFDIHAFEPLDANYMLLSSSIRLNQLDNIYLYPYGLSNGVTIGDRTSFIVDADNKGHSHIDSDASWSENDGKRIEIETVSLDEFSDILRSDHPEMYRSWQNVLWLKMDTEGFEQFVIRSGKKSVFSDSYFAPCFVRMEFRAHQRVLHELMTEAGYQMVFFDWNTIEQEDRVWQQRFDWLDERDLHQWDAVFVKRDIKSCIHHKMKMMSQIF